MAITGVYLEVDAPARVVHTETWGEGWPETTNTLEFVEVDGRTTLISTMAFPTREARDAALNRRSVASTPASPDWTST